MRRESDASLFVTPTNAELTQRLEPLLRKPSLPAVLPDNIRRLLEFYTANPPNDPNRF